MSSGQAPRALSTAPVVGILGGVGSGKSSVVRHVQGLQLQILDADRIGHELLSDPEVISQIRDRFGSAVTGPDGQILRDQLAARVFGESVAQQSGKRDLETILHPRIRQEVEARIRNESADADIIVLDAALLLEAGWGPVCDKLIFVDTPAAIREQRVIRDRGWAAGELQKREAAQFSVERKRAAADYVVDNSGSIADAARRMSEILQQLLNHS